MNMKNLDTLASWISQQWHWSEKWITCSEFNWVEEKSQINTPEGQLQELIDEFNKTIELQEIMLLELDKPTNIVSKRVADILTWCVDLEKEQKKADIKKIISDLKLLLSEVFDIDKIIPYVSKDIISFEQSDNIEVMFDKVTKVISTLININDFVWKKFDDFSTDIELDQWDNEFLSRAVANEKQMIKDIMEDYLKKHCYENLDKYSKYLESLTQQLEKELQDLSDYYSKTTFELDTKKHDLAKQFSELIINFNPQEELQIVDYSEFDRINLEIKTIIDEKQKLFNEYQIKKSELEWRISLWNELNSMSSQQENNFSQVLEKIHLFSKWFIKESVQQELWAEEIGQEDIIDIEKEKIFKRNMEFKKLWTNDTESHDVKYVEKEGNIIEVTHYSNNNKCIPFKVDATHNFVYEGRKCVMSSKIDIEWAFNCYEINKEWDWEQTDLYWFINEIGEVIVWNRIDYWIKIKTEKHVNWFLKTEIFWYIVNNSNRNLGYVKINWKKYKRVNHEYIKKHFEWIYDNFPQ